MQFRVLGPLEVADASGRPVELGSPKLRALLCLLLLEPGRVVPLDTIIDRLWSGEPPASATATLQAYVSNLRRLLEPGRGRREAGQVLATRAPGYLLVPSALDADELEALLGQGDAALTSGRPADALPLLDRARRLPRGRPLDDVADEPYAAAAVARLEHLCQLVEERYVEALLGTGAPGRAVAALEPLVRAYPLHERFRGQLVRALYGCGRQADALAAAATWRRHLRDELGLDPSPELQALEQSVLSHALPRAREELPAPPLAVPAPPAPVDDVVVGRERDRGHLTRLLQEAREGRGAVVTLEGEAGVGKSTLAESLVTQAGDLGARTVWVRCLQDVGAPPLWPWLQARAALAGEEPREVLPLEPDRDAAMFRVLDGVVDDLLAAARERWAVVVVDDLQWADRASLQLLRLLAAGVGAVPLLVVATVRRPDLGPGAPVEALLADLVRERSASRVALAALSQDEACALVQVLAPGTPARAARQVARRAEDNPFFLRELVRLLASEHGLDGGSDVPETVRAVIARRVERLPEDSRAVLRAAAVAGTEIELDVLACATATDADRVCDLLDAAVVTGLLVELEDRLGWRFSHALVRDAVRLALPRSQRARLHAAVTRALAQVHAGAVEAHLDELSYHSAEALGVLPPDEAVRWAGAAADRARARLGWDVAALHRLRALRALPGSAPGEQRFELLVRLAEELRLAGDVAASGEAVTAALEVARDLGDDLRAARALALRGGVVLWNTRAYGVVDEVCVAELERLLRDAPLDDALRAELLGTLGVELYYSDRRADGERAADEAVALARRTGDVPLLSRALNSLVLASWYPERDDARLAGLDEALALQGRGLPVQAEAVARLHRAAVRLRRADLAGATDDLARCAPAVAALGVPELRSQLRWAQAGLALLQDDRDRAESLREEAYAGMPEYGVWGAFWCRWVQLVELRSLQGRVDEVVDEVVRAAEEAGPLRAVAALAVARAGDLEGGARLLERWGGPHGAGSRHPDWNADHTLACWAEVAALTGAPAGRALYGQLLPLADRLVVAGTIVTCTGSTSRVLGLLARSLGELDAARAHLRVALRVEQEVGAPAYAALSRTALRALEDVGSRQG